jgi:hypothetical protein
VADDSGLHARLCSESRHPGVPWDDEGWGKRIGRLRHRLEASAPASNHRDGRPDRPASGSDGGTADATRTSRRRYAPAARRGQAPVNRARGCRRLTTAASQVRKPYFGSGCARVRIVANACVTSAARESMPFRLCGAPHNRKVALWLGHATLQSTEIYLRADPAEKNEMLGALAPLGIKPGKFRSPDKLIAMLASG